MQNKIEISPEMSLFLYMDEQQNNTKYVVEQSLPAGEFELKELDAQLELPAIMQGVTLNFTTSCDILIKGDFSGKMTVMSHKSIKYNLVIEGSLTEAGEIHTYGENTVTIKGSVAGKLYTRCPTFIENNVLASAIGHVQHLTVLGYIDDKSAVKSSQSLKQNSKINPLLEVKKGTASPSSILVPDHSKPRQPQRVYSSSFAFSTGFKKDYTAIRKREKLEAMSYHGAENDLIPLGKNRNKNVTSSNKELASPVNEVQKALQPSDKIILSPTLSFNNDTTQQKRKISEGFQPSNKNQPGKKQKPLFGKSLNETLSAPIVGQTGELKSVHIKNTVSTSPVKKRAIKEDSDDEFATFLEAELEAELKQPTTQQSTDIKQRAKAQDQYATPKKQNHAKEKRDDSAHYQDLAKELMYEELEFMDEFDKELDQYIRKDHEIVSENLLLNFEKSREKIVANVSSFVSKITPDGKTPFLNGHSTLTLRKHQIQAAQALKAMLEADITKGYIESPTGTGKTILMVLYYIAMGEPPTLILESRSNLINQTIKQFKKFIPDCDIGVYDGSHKEIGHNITVSTYQSLQSQYQKGVGKRDLTPDKYTLVFCDEAHNTLGKGRHEPIVEFFQSAFVIACSATIAYNTPRQIGSLRSMSQLFEYLIYSYKLTQAIEDRVLVPCQNIKVFVDAKIDFDAIRKPAKSSSSAQEDEESADDFNMKELGRLLNQKKINQIPVLLYANGVCSRTGERLLGKTAVVFAIGVNNAKEIAKEFNLALSNHPYFKQQGGIAAIAIDGTLSTDTKRKILQQHEDGRIKVLVCDLLCTEGYDNPNVEVIFNSKPTRSIVVAPQRGGRATRLSSHNPNKVAMVFDLVYPGLDGQITYDQFLDNRSVFGEQFIKRSNQAVKEWETINTLETEPFRVDPSEFILLNNSSDLTPQDVQDSTNNLSSTNEFDLFSSKLMPTLQPKGEQKSYTAAREIGYFKHQDAVNTVTAPLNLSELEQEQEFDWDLFNSSPGNY